MKSFEVERNQTNVEALNEAIRTSLGEAFSGLSTRPGFVTLYFSDEATGTEMEEARNLAILHDPAVLSSRQAGEQARRKALATARQRHQSPLDESQFDSEAGAIQALAARVAWLEQEIRDLCDL